MFHHSYLQQNSLNERIYGRREGLPVFIVKPEAFEAPNKDASFAKNGKKVNHAENDLFSRPDS